MNRLVGIQRALERSNSDRLIHIEMQFREELEFILCHEELLWKKKSRCDCLHLGGCNTKIFTIVRSGEGSLITFLPCVFKMVSGVMTHKSFKKKQLPFFIKIFMVKRQLI